MNKAVRSFFRDNIIHELWTKLSIAAKKFVHNDVHKIVHRGKSVMALIVNQGSNWMSFS